MENNKRIAISGASGFVGTALSNHFKEEGYEIIPLPRQYFEKDFFEELKKTLSSCMVVINLAGAPLLHRWTKTYKKTLYDSRIQTTRSLVNAMNSLAIPPAVFISASAVGYYPPEGCFDEYNAVRGEGFLSGICAAWEKEAFAASDRIRTVITRFAVILAKKGGAYEKMALPARYGLGCIFGTGSQYFPWISLADLVRAIDLIVKKDSVKGVVNMVSPGLVDNKTFMHKVARHYKSYLTIPIPSFVLKSLLGESADFILEGQCVQPTRLNEEGFLFQHKTLEDFLATV